MPTDIVVNHSLPRVAGKHMTLTAALLSAWEHEDTLPELAKYSARDARFIDAWRVRLGVISAGVS